MRILMVTVVSAVAALLLPASAGAAFHLMKVSEVYVDGADPAVAYVELQMYADGQHRVGGHFLSVYSQGGVETKVPLTSDAANGGNQRTILIATDAAAAMFGSDFTGIPPGVLQTGGGAVCFETIDCMSWGGFAGSTQAPSGDPAPAISTGRSLERTIEPGCETLLEAGDDSDDSDTDFFSAVPSPRTNATEPSERPCDEPGPGGDSRLEDPTLRAKRFQRQQGRRQVIRLTLGAGEDAAVNVKARVKAGGKSYRLKESAQLLAGEPIELKLRTGGRDARRIARALASGARVKAKLKARFSDEAGNRAVRRATVTLG